MKAKSIIDSPYTHFLKNTLILNTKGRPSAAGLSKMRAEGDRVQDIRQADVAALTDWLLLHPVELGYENQYRSGCPSDERGPGRLKYVCAGERMNLCGKY